MSIVFFFHRFYLRLMFFICHSYPDNSILLLLFSILSHNQVSPAPPTPAVSLHLQHSNMTKVHRTQSRTSKRCKTQGSTLSFTHSLHSHQTQQNSRARFSSIIPRYHSRVVHTLSYKCVYFGSSFVLHTPGTAAIDHVVHSLPSLSSVSDGQKTQNSSQRRLPPSAVLLSICVTAPPAPEPLH